MEPDINRQILVGCIEDLKHDMNVLYQELDKAHIMTAPSRRARLLTIKLQDHFKKFRKLSCDAGLK